MPVLSNIGGVLIYALDGAEQLEGYAAADWVISDLVRWNAWWDHCAQPIRFACWHFAASLAFGADGAVAGIGRDR